MIYIWSILWVIGIPIFYALIYKFWDKEVTWISLIWPISVPVTLFFLAIILVLMYLEKGIKRFDRFLDTLKIEK